jgi:hypothetical protein
LDFAGSSGIFSIVTAVGSPQTSPMQSMRGFDQRLAAQSIGLADLQPCGVSFVHGTHKRRYRR